MTVEGTEFLYSESKQDAAVTNLERGGSTGAAASTRQDDNADGPSDIPDEDLDGGAARVFVEKLCQKTAKDWAVTPQKDDAAKTAMTYIENDTPSKDITEEGLGLGMDVRELK